MTGGSKKSSSSTRAHTKLNVFGDIAHLEERAGAVLLDVSAGEPCAMCVP